MTPAPSISRLRALLMIPTISRLDEQTTNWSEFQRFIDEVRVLYPNVHATLDCEIVAGYSLLYRWRGAGTGTGTPTVLMAHYDVVSATDDGWEHPPFAAKLVGEGDDELIWGRGTLDNKGSLASILEAVDLRAASGFVPANDIYLSFGHDEETTGSGARAVVALLAERGIRPGLVLDEGGAIVDGILPGVDRRIALIGVSEKGIASVALTVDQDGGHASTPPRFAATARLARAIVRLNRSPFPARFSPTNLEMIRTIGAHATGPLRLAFTHLWLTRPLLLWLFARLGDETNAMTRTTQAVTMLSGSQAANALAERAEAIVNLRIAVGSSVAETVRHVRRAVRDPLVRIEPRNLSEPSPVSPSSGRAWRLLGETILEVYPETVVTPYVMLGASDSRQFTRLSGNVYRFSPFEMSKAERGALHAANERMHVATFLRGVEFFDRLIGKL